MLFGRSRYEDCSTYGCCTRLATKINLGRSYIFVLGLIGTALAAGDVARIIICGPEIPDNLRRSRYTPGCIVPIRYERDLKLLSSALILEFFVLMLIGTTFDKPDFLFPWLAMQTCMIIGESFLFLLRLLEGCPINFNSWVTICSLFAIFNWLQVFGEFKRMDDECIGFANICGYKM